MQSFIKILLVTLFLTGSYTLHAQLDSASVLIRFKGGYADYSSSNGVSSLGAVNAANTEWNLDLSVGWKVGKAEVGLGVEYRKQKSEALSEIYRPNEWMAVQQTETKIHLFLGKLYFARHFRLFNRFYFIPDFTLYYGIADGKQDALTASREALSSESFYVLQGGNSSSLTFYTQDISYDYLAFRLAPAFAFFITQRFALHLETGSFQFSMVDAEWDNRQFVANINPSYWQLGIMFAF